MQLFVQYPGASRTFVLEVGPHSSIAELKQLLSIKLQSSEALQNLRLVHNGQQLSDAQSLESAAIGDGSTVSAICRLLGGGGDGGSTGAESRSCYLEMYAQKKADKVDPAEEKLARWTRCHLTGELLRPPCVCDRVGNLYNKDAVVSALLHKTLPSELAHITSLKHVTNLQLERNPRSSNQASTSGTGYKQNESDFLCPVTGLEFNGRFRFLVHKKTGKVVTERAVKELPVVVEELLGQKWTSDDWLPVNPIGEELRQLREKVVAEKAKRNKKKAGTATDGDATKKRTSDATAASQPSKKVKAADHMPAVATKDVYASLFTSSEKEPQKETFLCRSTGAQSKIRS